METITLRGRDGIGLAADVVGDPSAPPVVLFHGGGQTRHAWGTTLQVLGERGWRAYSVDLRGHGQSDWDVDGDYTLDELVDLRLGRRGAHGGAGACSRVGASGLRRTAA